MSTTSKIAVATLCTGEYRIGAEVLFHTLKKYGGMPEGVDCLAMGVAACDFAKPTPCPDYSWIPTCPDNFPNVAAKLHALTLPYDRIIMLDADMLCVGDCSQLWGELPLPIYAYKDWGAKFYYQHRVEQLGLNQNRIINTGAVVLHPSKLPEDFASRFLDLIRDNKLRSYDSGDQGYVNQYLQEFCEVEIGQLPQAYNCCLDRHTPQLSDEYKRIVHFTGGNAKPWNPTIRQRDWRWPYIQRWRKERDTL